VAQKPRDAVVIFLSKFTAASRGTPCDSTALVLLLLVHSAASRMIILVVYRNRCTVRCPMRQRRT